MTKYARVQNGFVQEIVFYNPYEVVNENFHNLFHPCPDEVEVSWSYNEETEMYTKPEPELEPEVISNSEQTTD
jgi:hypothetical protein